MYKYLNYKYINTSLITFYFDKSGKDNNDEQLENISFISVTLLVFHFDKSGKDDNDEHSENI